MYLFDHIVASECKIFQYVNFVFILKFVILGQKLIICLHWKLHFWWLKFNCETTYAIKETHCITAHSKTLLTPLYYIHVNPTVSYNVWCTVSHLTDSWNWFDTKYTFLSFYIVWLWELWSLLSFYIVWLCEWWSFLSSLHYPRFEWVYA